MLENPDGVEQQGAEKIAVTNDRDVWIQEVDTALKEWSQGDCVLGEQWFVYRFNPKRPLAAESANVAQDQVDLTESEVIAESEVKGFAVITQTCDIVRTCDKRPFVEIVPLVEVDGTKLHEIQRGRRPQYAYIPGVAKFNLVADLDRVMTVEKAVIAEWERIPGCKNDQDIRALRQALARKRIRFAFPDDFIRFASKLQKRMQDKHDKDTDEGKALRALREIRVRAEPSWNAQEVTLMFWFIRHEEQSQFNGIGWDQFLEKWLELIPESGRFQNVDGVVKA